MQVHEGNGSGGSSSSNKKEYFKGVYRWEGNNRYLYSWYYLRGSVYMEKTLANPKKATIQKPAPTPSRKATPKKKTSSSNARRTTTAKTTRSTKPKSIPAKPKAVRNPGKLDKKPSPPAKFKFTKAEPKKKEILIPQAPAHPGPEPKYAYEEQKSITKYEYLMGIKHMEIKHKQYEQKSIFVSQPMQIEGNVMQVSLRSIEEHPLFDELSGDATNRQTSVEYYIAYSENPSLDEWYPMLPEEEKTVTSELVMFDTARTAKLRFPALIGSVVTPVLYRDGLEVKDELWSFGDGGTKLQLLTTYEPTSIYTINYTPNSEFYNPWVLDIKEQGMTLQKQVDTFIDGTSHNKTVVLTKYPYIDYAHINTTNEYSPNTDVYKPLQVRLKNAKIVGPSKTTHTEVLPYNGIGNQVLFTKNVTDYKEGFPVELKPYNIDSKSDTLYNGFEYYHENNKLYFSETFNKSDIYTNEQTNHGNAEVEVEYQYMVSNFRIKVILRRNTSEESTLSPVVHEYALKFKVMK